MFSNSHRDELDSDIFIFSSLDSKKPLTARKVHIRRLFDVLQLCIQRNDAPRAARAWAILARCKEIRWMTLWTTAIHVLSIQSDSERNAHVQTVELLRALMLQRPEDREAIFQELILHLIVAGNHREALDELELYLPSYPYQDNPVLHVYAGLISLYLSQPSGETSDPSFEQNLLREAQSHFERATMLDPHNIVAQGFIEKIPGLARRRNDESQGERDSDDDNDMVVDEGNSDTSQSRKRART